MITIIVLLILAVVAIGAVQDDGIINHAKNARDQYGAAQVNENSTIQAYLDKIKEHVGTGSGVGTGTGGNNNTNETETNETKFSFVYNVDKTAKITGIKSLKSGITELTFPSEVVYEDETYSVTEINWELFIDCSGITSIVIPETITIVSSEEGFQKFSNLTSVTWNAKKITVKYDAFKDLTKLTNFTFSEGLETINLGDERSSLKGCTNLKNITIPSTVTEIGEYSFAGTSLTSVFIPASVTDIGEYAFGNCTSLTDIYCEAESKPDGWTMSEDYKWNQGTNANVHWNVISFKIAGTEYKAQRGMKWSQWIDSTEYNSKDFSYTTYRVFYDLDTLIVVDENSTIVNPESEIGSGGTYKLSA